MEGTPQRIITSPLVRLALLLIGGFASFQSSSNGLKAVYAALAAAMFLVSLGKLAVEHDPRIMRFRGFTLASLAMVALLFATYAVAVSNGATSSDWLHDVIPYLLAFTLPIVGIEAGAKLQRRRAVQLLVASGAFSTLAFAVTWLTRRGVATNQSIGFGSQHLQAALFVYALARAAIGRRDRGRWALLAAATLGVGLLTGTRTNLVLVVGVLGMLGARAAARIPVARAVRAMVGALVLLAGVVEVGMLLIPGEKELIATRLGALVNYLAGGPDQSATGRSHDNNLAHGAFNGHALFGTGPGFLYPDPYFIPHVTNPAIYVHGYAFTLDSPLLPLAKFGIVGVLLLAAWLVTLGFAAVHTRRALGPSIERTTLWGWLVVAAALQALAVGMDSKGFALSLMVLLAAFVAQPSPVLAPEFSAPAVEVVRLAHR